ncbi:uncharacterized protein SPAPADRAFT_65242 [Spathaspora passalidarum NRRL Y-27907]|uniref:SET domain-containing protein n=1 Tax=Spathaspora passalidarum (strain NRRL Y-27907 / 11-Y1) TaxID=619300 RepID=G3AK08_SPAPN|nr:uncharacterized protein SPAPADRAFT_65242 [Spathaspora passalidarum NRRL Y-27907]EGW34059.1 hypothetical protein SPAPADRAFT_65242 [Spathaspora passalidarum NRRL Y-27907]
MELENVLKRFKLTEQDLAILESKVYWERKLIALLLQYVYIFPNDENSKREFNDCVSNEKVQVTGKYLTPGKRGVVACKDFKQPGEVIMEINPVAVPSSDSIDCFTKNYQIEELEKVLEPYINKVHPGRKEEDDITFQLVIRVYLTYLYDPHYKARVDNLCTHQHEQRLDPIREYITLSQSRLVQILTDFLNSSTIGKSVLKEKSLIHSQRKGWKFLEALICVVLINHNILLDQDNEPIGIGLDPDFSLINHSCAPNCILKHKQNWSGFELVNTVPIVKNSELTVTYIDTCFPKELRMLDLRSRYFFNCKCELCSKQEDPYFSYCCPYCHGALKTVPFVQFLINNNYPPPTCLSCSKTISSVSYNNTNYIIKFFLASILFCHRKFVNADSPEHILFLTKELEMNCKAKLKDVIEGLLLNSDDFTLEDSQFNIVYRLINEIIQYNVFPVYAFPMNRIIGSLDETKETKELTILGMRLNLGLINTLLVTIPSDLSHQESQNGSMFLELAGKVLHILSVANDVNYYSIGDRRMDLGVLCLCGEFFTRQVGVKSKELIVQQYLEVYQEFSKKWPIENPEPQVSLTHYCLRQLFEFANISHLFIETTTEFRLYNAKREVIPLFYI